MKHSRVEDAVRRTPFFGSSRKAERPFFAKREKGGPVLPAGQQRHVQRQEGDHTRGGSGSGGTAASTIPAAISCTPRGLSRAQFLRANGNDQSVFGQTVFTANRSMLTPSTLQFQRVGRRVKPTAVSINLPAASSIYTQGGVFDEGTARLGEGGSCLAGDYPKRWIITGDGADKIRDGEQEHCDDYSRAYQLSVLPYVRLVNSLAAGRRTFASERSAKSYMQRQLGFSPDNWFYLFGCLLLQSTTRDYVQRGEAYSWHYPIPHVSGLDSRCRYVRVNITGRSLPQVGQHPASGLITTRDC
ncbi:MAG: hypothetical protein KDC66_08140 [Phaeodactylibacter sp.]|nr:hypothetical protein [Phaeodactylibacter sp.]MCB9274929.1 hypothetical protein [Lewinellaceae bacterium]